MNAAPPGPRGTLRFSLTLVLIGAAILSAGYFLEGDRLGHKAGSFSVAGEVISIKAVGGIRTGNHAAATVQYVLPDGRVKYYTSDVGEAQGTYRLGQKVPILYNARTQSALIDSFADLYVPVLLFGATGGLFLVPRPRWPGGVRLAPGTPIDLSRYLGKRSRRFASFGGS